MRFHAVGKLLRNVMDVGGGVSCNYDATGVIQGKLLGPIADTDLETNF